jgi:hypothetical protein
MGRCIAAGRNDAVKGAAVDDQILYERKCLGPPRFYINGIAILELSHMKLTNRRLLLGSVRDAVDDLRTYPANGFTAVMVKGYRLLALFDQVFVDFIKHLEE